MGRVRLFGVLTIGLVLLPSAVDQAAAQVQAQTQVQTQAPAQPVKSIAEFTQGMEKRNGFFPLYWDAVAGKLWLQIGRFDEEFLYITSMPWGVGSNELGLDRGQLGGTKVVYFQRIGPKVLLMQRNYGFRADGASPEAARAVEQSFARSVIWGTTVAAEEEGRVLVEANGLLIRDAQGVARALRRGGQGSYQLDAGRSAVHLPMTRNFPDNTEMEVVLTFGGEPLDRLIGSVTPSADAVTVQQHHSFVRLPNPGYKPRRFDPRCGYSVMSYMDFATPFDRPLVKRFINRHWLEKKDPAAAASEAVEPIVYYVDPGIPEPIKSAVIEGARWWSTAFEAAGYKNAWRVEELPAGADPMDVRYNLVQWVHRSTRGWSYGGSVTDPRTGEIIKGHVTLGSLRIRQAYLIAAAMSAPYVDGDKAPAAVREMALQRIRQLAAHEIGHTLGLMHNYASSVNNRASVMDYPHPLLRLNERGRVDFKEAYTNGIGEWDKVTIAYGYQDFPDGTNEDAELDKILARAFKRGLLFVSDADARPAGGAHPSAHLWDNGSDAVVELERVLRLRAAALDNFSENNIRAADPMCTLEEVLVPLYLFHRYQAQAAVKVLGGLNYSYALRGDGQPLTEMIDPAAQRRALETLLETVSPETLTLPERIVAMIPPRAPGYQRGGAELFARRTGVTFDPLSAAEAAAGMSLELIFNPERASRLVEYKARDGAQPGLGEVIERVLDATWQEEEREGLAAEVAKVVGCRALRQVMALAVDGRASDQARAIALLKLKEFQAKLLEGFDRALDEGLKAHYFAAGVELELFLKDPQPERIPPAPAPPPGDPIG